MLSKFRYILILALLLVAGFKAGAQIAMPDSVCIGATKHYWINGLPGSTYEWKIDGVIQASNTFEIYQTWNLPGDFILTVQETSADGCIGPIQSGHV
ncbi:MAG: hypothetical protein IPH84_06795, partial [Bacteroidales bacterium]|nr:hypothetical protein [Bacteroidales bacterium]